MITHQLTVPELEFAASFGSSFYTETKMPGKFNPELFIRLWTHLFETGQGMILGLYEGREMIGALAAMVAPDIYDMRLISHEFFLYIRPEYRNSGGGVVQLVQGYEEWAAEKGVAPEDVRLAYMEGFEPENMAKLYRRLGYLPLERHFYKGVS